MRGWNRSPIRLGFLRIPLLESGGSTDGAIRAELVDNAFKTEADRTGETRPLAGPRVSRSHGWLQRARLFYSGNQSQQAGSIRRHHPEQGRLKERCRQTLAHERATQPEQTHGNT